MRGAIEGSKFAPILPAGGAQAVNALRNHAVTLMALAHAPPPSDAVRLRLSA
jgi:hypothetical protein